MKKILALTFALALVVNLVAFTGITASAAKEGAYEYEITNGEATITRYNGSAAELTIPSTLGGYPVTAIDNSAFFACRSLTSVTIPDSITTIGDSAFLWCESLTSINIPNNVTTIGDSAFSGCESLTSVNIPNSVTTIGNGAFANCLSLNEIEVAANNPKYVSENGILFNKNKTTLMCYPAAKENITYSVPDSVTVISDYAFMGCQALTSVNIPNNITIIGDAAFMGCEALTSVNIPNSVTTIGESVFRSCKALTSINIPNSVTTIGESAFAECVSLKEVKLGDSVKTIGKIAFSECSALTKVTLGRAITAIEDGAFRGCSSLTDVYYSGNETDRGTIYIGSNNAPLGSATWHYNHNPAPDSTTPPTQTIPGQEDASGNGLDTLSLVMFISGLVMMVIGVTTLIIALKKKKQV